MTKKVVTRDDLRAATVGAKVVLKKETVEWNGLKYEIRQASLAERKLLRQKVFSEDGSIDIFETLVWLVIRQTYVPGTDDRVFEETDYDIFMNNPAGTFVDEFGEIAAKINNLDVEGIAKN
jgi:hypothetical protein